MSSRQLSHESSLSANRQFPSETCWMPDGDRVEQRHFEFSLARDQRNQDRFDLGILFFEFLCHSNVELADSFSDRRPPISTIEQSNHIPSRVGRRTQCGDSKMFDSFQTVSFRGDLGFQGREGVVDVLEERREVWACDRSVEMGNRELMQGLPVSAEDNI